MVSSLMHHAVAGLLLSITACHGSSVKVAGNLLAALSQTTSASFTPAYPYTATVCAVTPLPVPAAVFHCRFPGRLNSPDVLTPSMKASSLLACADVCQADQDCVSFGFDTSAKVCTLYGLPLTDMGLVGVRQSLVLYSNRHCYACGPSSTGVSVTFLPTSTSSSLSSSTASITEATAPSQSTTSFGGVSELTTSTIVSGGTTIAEILIPASTTVIAGGDSPASTVTSVNQAGNSAIIEVYVPASTIYQAGGTAAPTTTTSFDPSSTSAVVEVFVPAATTTVVYTGTTAQTTTIYNAASDSAIVEIQVPASSATIFSGSVAETTTIFDSAGDSATINYIYPVSTTTSYGGNAAPSTVTIPDAAGTSAVVVVEYPAVSSTIIGGTGSASTTTSTYPGGSSAVVIVNLPGMTTTSFGGTALPTTITSIDSAGDSGVVIAEYPASTTTILSGTAAASVSTSIADSGSSAVIEVFYPVSSTTIYSGTGPASTTTIFNTVASTAIVEVFQPAAGYQTSTSYLASIGAAPYTSTIAQPSGTSAGVVIVGTPDAYVTATTFSGTVSTTTTATAVGSGTGTVIVVQPSKCGTAGIDYAVYTDLPSTNNDVTFDPASIKTLTPSENHTWTYIGPLSYDSSNDLRFYTNTKFTAPTQFVINHRGYFWVPSVGTYTFGLDNVDDVMYLWFGAKAYSGWTMANADVMARFETGGAGTAEYVATTAGVYLPVRAVFAQGGGAFSFKFFLNGTDGSSLSTGYVAPTFVTNACDAEIAQGPVFPDFGSET